MRWGGRDVHEARLTEVLWPDADGDNAHSAFTTTLSRLRKLLGSEVLQVNNASLSLNDHYCWLDSWAFERALGELETLLSSADELDTMSIQDRMQKVFDLYHGQFMEKEPQSGWMLPQRERLRVKLLRIIKRLIAFYSHTGHCKKVITLHEKAHELDPLSEEYYCGLMKCHAALGDSAKALAVYDVCSTILQETFGIKPSEKTRNLHQLIQTGQQQQLKHLCELCAHAAEKLAPS